MKDLISRFIGKPTGKSKEEAKNRLKFLLIHDQVDLTPAQLENMKKEIIEVIGRYVEIEIDDTTFKLEREEGHIALVSSFPVRRVVQRAATG
jgi:cell division topological specificity factor